MSTPRDTGRNRYARIAPKLTSRCTTAFTRVGIVTLLVTLLATTPVAAQTGTSFCNTQMAQTIRNMFTIIQLGGPLIGGLVTLGATVAIPLTRRSDRKKMLKEMRNQALVYGVLVAPLGTEIITFLLNNVVAGGTSCGF